MRMDEFLTVILVTSPQAVDPLPKTNAVDMVLANGSPSVPKGWDFVLKNGNCGDEGRAVLLVEVGGGDGLGAIVLPRPIAAGANSAVLRWPR